MSFDAKSLKDATFGILLILDTAPIQGSNDQILP